MYMYMYMHCKDLYLFIFYHSRKYYHKYYISFAVYPSMEQFDLETQKAVSLASKLTSLMAT